MMMDLLYPPIAYCNLGKYRFEYEDPSAYAVIRHRAWQCPSRSLRILHWNAQSIAYPYRSPYRSSYRYQSLAYLVNVEAH